jgi:hypothetical protein
MELPQGAKDNSKSSEMSAATFVEKQVGDRFDKTKLCYWVIF